jgi:outer membrane protein assembly factor BamA
MWGIYKKLGITCVTGFTLLSLLGQSGHGWAQLLDPAEQLLDPTEQPGVPDQAAQQSDPVESAESGVPAESTPPAPKKIISEITIGGNEQVEGEAIRIRLSSRPGEPLNPETVDADIRSIYEMGFFSNVEARTAEHSGKTVLTYWVRERPLIRQVLVEGQEKISKEDLLTALKIHPRTILNPVKIRRGIMDAKKTYEEKGYLDTDISYRTETTGNG